MVCRQNERLIENNPLQRTLSLELTFSENLSIRDFGESYLIIGLSFDLPMRRLDNEV